VRIHSLTRPERVIETQFVTHRAQVRSIALERLIDVIRSRNAADRKAVS
jgi:hypothetical protein